ERMLAHLQVLLEGILADPSLRLSDLPLLTAAERRQLLVEWNTTQAAYPQTCFHALFEVQAARTPDAVAVVFHDRPTTDDHRPTPNTRHMTPDTRHLTYAELNARANQ